MRTIRRFYVYLVAFISLLVVTWGVIGLTRSLFGGRLIGSEVNQLASALSLIAVGIPVFLLHWWLAQRSLHDSEENFSRLRAIFLYGSLLATMVPMAQNTLAYLNHTWLQIFHLPTRLAFLGEGQTWLDNITAIVVNAMIAAYIFAVVKRNWNAIPPKAPSIGNNLQSTRNLYRYIWVIYGLAMVIGGTEQVLQTIFNISGTSYPSRGATLANGLALLIVGTPIWIYAWRKIQDSLTSDGEQPTPLRLFILFVLNLIGIGGVLVPCGLVLSVVIRLILGETMTFNQFMTAINVPISTGIPFAGAWGYYRHILKDEVASISEITFQAMLNRLYHHILSFVGLATTFLGTNAILTLIIDLFIRTTTWAGYLRSQLANAIALLTVGIPLWIIHWRINLIEASKLDELGDHARRSLIRKTYLYLTLFAGVIGVMTSGGSLIFQLVSKILGSQPENFERTSLILFEILVLFTVVLIYHWLTLRSDGRLADQTLEAHHRNYPVAILDDGVGDFSEEILNILQKEIPALPVEIHTPESIPKKDGLSKFKAVILPGSLTAHSSQSVTGWIRDFTGTRIVIPTAVDGWFWTYGSGRSLSSLADQTAKIVRHLAEGKKPPEVREASPWTIIFYILAVIIGIPTLIGVILALSEMLN